MSIDNDAAVNTSGTGFSRGISILTGGAPAGGTYSHTLNNSATLDIGTAFGQGILVGATVDDDATAMIINSGLIDLSASTSSSLGGILINLGGAGPNSDGTTSATLTNNGAIDMGAGVGVSVAADTITGRNSGSIGTLGTFSDGVDLVGTGAGPIDFTTTSDISVEGANSDAIGIYGPASVANITIDGATLRAPTDIAKSQNAAIRVGDPINAAINAINGAAILGDVSLNRGNDGAIFSSGSGLLATSIPATASTSC